MRYIQNLIDIIYETVNSHKLETAGEYAVHYQKGDDAAALYRAAQIYLPDEMLFRGCGV